MDNRFFEKPILNSPYAPPSRHWELDADGQPTQRIIDKRRPAKYVTPVPKPRKRKDVPEQGQLPLDASGGISGPEQAYDPTPLINELRREVDLWRRIPDPHHWGVSPTTVSLLRHWRHHRFSHIRPFFCQVEAVETLIYLTEALPRLVKNKAGTGGRKLPASMLAAFQDPLDRANADANPGLNRLALKLATGAGKTTVMAMIIAWQTINEARAIKTGRAGREGFTRGFLVITPGITIRERLRVLMPNDPDSYYRSRELVPQDMLDDLSRAVIVITNYHAFKLRERIPLARGTRALLQGQGEALQTLETEGQMIHRVMPELEGMKRIMVLNDEAHHCYREKPGDKEEERSKGEDREEAQRNNEAARLWISGIEAVQRKVPVSRVVDLSATPFFLRGSGYAEGTLFPWTMSDFSLMDAIECGIVKLPRVPVADNVPGAEMPRFRELWEHIRQRMPKKGRGAAGALDPLHLPVELQTALDALYGHYRKTFDSWRERPVPPCFIVVCNNTATSKLVYDYIAGFERPPTKDGVVPPPFTGKFPLFSNYDENGRPLALPRTILIDSEQLESGEVLDPDFRKMAATEIERFRREIVQRTGDRKKAESIGDQELLREVMNTVGKEGRLGAGIRCVVSVSMLTEGWDANTVTHVLGVRAFGTQLLCEQVMGRALRRQSYDLNAEGLFDVEYADVLGIPFDFTAKPVVVPPPPPPPPTIQVKAVRPERDDLEIRFPRVRGYRVELPTEQLTATFTEDSVLELTPDLVGPSITKNQGIVGEEVDLTLEHLKDMRRSSLVFHLVRHLIYTKWRDPGDDPQLQLFGQLKRITTQWVESYLVCKGGTHPAQLAYQELADMACERITAAVTRAMLGDSPIKAILDPYNPAGSTRHVNFTTSRTERWQTDPRRCHVNWVICDSGWEAEFCRVAESHPRVRAYVKNHNLGLEVPYPYGSETRTYLPDFIVLVEDGREDPLHLIVEIKGYRGEDAKDKKAVMETRWVPGVNRLGSFGRWAFAEFTGVYEIESDFKARVEAEFQRMIETVTG